MSELRNAIREILDTTTDSDPVKIAAQLLDTANRATRDRWIEEVLPGYVADEMRFERNKALASAAKPSPKANSARSAKVSGIRDWWAQLMAARVAVEDGWKALGDCDCADLEYLAAERERHAEATLAQAEKYRLIASKLAKHKVQLVRSLPRTSLDELRGMK